MHSHPHTKRLQLSVGMVDRVIISSMGPLRVRITYEDHEEEEDEACNVLPWLLNSSGKTYLEETSRVDAAAMGRAEHLFYTL